MMECGGSLYELRNLGKGCYEAAKTAEPAHYQQAYNSMTNSQKSMFWDAYNHRKGELMESIGLSTTAKALVKRIYRAGKRELPRLKASRSPCLELGAWEEGIHVRNRKPGFPLLEEDVPQGNGLQTANKAFDRYKMNRADAVHFEGQGWRCA